MLASAEKAEWKSKVQNTRPATKEKWRNWKQGLTATYTKTTESEWKGFSDESWHFFFIYYYHNNSEKDCYKKNNISEKDHLASSELQAIKKKQSQVLIL